MEVSAEDMRALVRDKYHGDESADLSADLARLQTGEPLAYVIGWIPFMSLHIDLASRPLIPRTETEWWTEKLIGSLKERFGDAPFTLLDLCAGSGAIGLSVLHQFPNATVSFGEVDPNHVEQIRKNISLNNLDESRADVRESDLFEAFEGEQFDVIATNPPYVPQRRTLPESVSLFEPAFALYGGDDGLSVIRRIAHDVRTFLKPGGSVWLECDTEHIEEVQALFGAAATIHQDQYGRPRFVVSY